MTTASTEFSVSRHAVFLDGYLDAAGRALSTDAELYALCIRTPETDQEIEAILGKVVRRRDSVDNWPREFGWLVEGLLGMNQRIRLWFYLIDYICWFKEFTNNAVCFKVDCEHLRANTISQAIYVLELESSQNVLIIAERSKKEGQSDA